MKSIKTIITFFFVINICSAQNGFTNKAEATNITDANGLKQGKWIEYLDTVMKPTTTQNLETKYFTLTVYKDNKEIETIRTFYFPSGHLKLERTPSTDGEN